MVARVMRPLPVDYGAKRTQDAEYSQSTAQAVSDSRFSIWSKA
jgi:hypothetical protein